MSEVGFYAISAFIFAAIIGGVIWFGIWVSEAQCYARWPDRNPSFGVLQGCVIDTDEGRIPASNYRVL